MGNPPPSSFDGEAVDDNTILVKYTWNGDADLNGKVDADAYFRIDQGLQNQPAPSYRTGDFDYSQSRDEDDYYPPDLTYLRQSMVLAVQPAPGAQTVGPADDDPLFHVDGETIF